METKYRCFHLLLKNNIYVKLPTKEEKIDCHDKTKYWPTITNKGLNWLHFFVITEFTADRIENEKKSYLNC